MEGVISEKERQMKDIQNHIHAAFTVLAIADFEFLQFANLYDNPPEFFLSSDVTKPAATR